MKRTVTVKDYSTQSCKVFEDIEVSTWKELREIIESSGISTQGKTVKEGVSKVDFINDETFLPHDIPFKGSLTNDLFILLFPETKENISLGAGPSRNEVIAKIKEQHLEQAVKDITGRSWTQVSTAKLTEILAEANTAQAEIPELQKQETTAEKVESNIRNLFLCIISELEALQEAPNTELRYLLDLCFPPSQEKGFSSSEIADMEHSLGI